MNRTKRKQIMALLTGISIVVIVIKIIQDGTIL